MANAPDDERMKPPVTLGGFLAYLAIKDVTLRFRSVIRGSQTMLVSLSGWARSGNPHHFTITWSPGSKQSLSEAVRMLAENFVAKLEEK
jgi:hypothetical protein